MCVDQQAKGHLLAVWQECGRVWNAPAIPVWEQEAILIRKGQE